MSSRSTPCRPGLAPALLLAAVLAPALAAAAEPAASRAGARSPAGSGAVWAVARFVYKAEGKRVAEVLQDFGASQGLPVVLAEGVEGTVQGSFDSAPEAFLEAMAKAYGLLWYHDGSALYIYPAQAIQSRLFRLKGFRRGQVSDLLESLRLGDRRYTLRYDSNEQTLLVYGPPRHVELVAAAVEQLDAGVVERNRRTVRVVPLRFASAADRMLGTTRLPGLASTLNELFASAARAPAEAAAAPPPLVIAQPEKARPLQGLFGADRSLADLGARRAEAAARPPAPAPRPVPPADDDDTPQFRADEGTNSLLVQGRPQRMAEYLDLINRLDLRPVLVELEATIIDVSSDSIDSLGISWSAQGPRGGVSLNAPPADAGATPFRLSTLWSNAGRELLGRIDALSANGKAHIVAKPRVLGAANRPAVMKERRIIVVRVPGNLEANLFQLEAGTLLQMTPSVSSSDGTTRIRLTLNIEDGSFEDRTVDGVPVQKHMVIATEAHVLEGESLLVGGITTTLESVDKSEVPVLSRVPLLGALFRSSSDKRARTERMFLITPRVIRDIAQLPAPDAERRPD